MAELIISEKPKSAQRIAEALADGKPIRKKEGTVSYYEITHKGKDIIVASSVGHLFGLAEKEKKGLRYPVFDIEWKPLFEISKDGHFSKKYHDVLEKLSKKATSFVIGCDLDTEGEVIGLNILRYVCRQKDGRRMKFSTLTKPDLLKAYEKASPKIEWGLAIAGETRHNLDYYYGINLSRALTSSIKKAGMFKILSIGRVQGPALKIIVDKEKEIAAFKTKPYWQIELHGEVKEGMLVALHRQDKFWEKKEAEAIYKKTLGKDGRISDVRKKELTQQAPFPFDLTTLQTEAYRCFGINPKVTLSIAQDLYTSGCISYPRTSSQQLPASIEYEKILKQLQKMTEYNALCTELLKKKALQPNNGKKTDPAHPAIFPTGVKPVKLNELNKKVYDLVVRRFMATFAEPAIRETMTGTIEIEGEEFLASGTTTKYEGWYKYYGQYAKLKEEELPKLEIGEKVSQKKLEMSQKETKPPARYTPASIIKELEKRNLGTKATRADVVDTLYQRGYILDKAIAATELGIKTVETLEKYSPKVVNEDLTRHFEVEMDEVMEGKKKQELVLEEAREVLGEILAEFKKKEKDIGTSLFEATKTAETRANTVGKCVACNEGTLMIKRGRFGRFIACSRYPECKVTFKLPSNGFVKTIDSMCEHCSHPKILVIRKRKQPQEVCINPDCPSKEIKSDRIGEKCEKCKEGTLVLRKSIYGQFVACNNFPKCRNIIRSAQKPAESSQ